MCCNVKLLFVLLQKAIFSFHLMSLHAIWENFFSFLVKVMTHDAWLLRGGGVRVCLRLYAHIMPSILKFTENSNYIAKHFSMSWQNVTQLN